ncbi:zinc ABC transporter substrate-binding protein [Limosilactobacillus sp. STM2_1]|uniref:Zinc ABC transporter substrate-binding protein n=1 Tax=Limosilactobacillus rudii TaxID=2759755 RepID=A0A7W3UNM1_9LACO|nr:zinc ABC transporter substrate-binding protein [Limosilactobacillus rudii]MBB1079014.1 zinc ABC transporter substrate-binding protein [Limosilactobacillus rudii]MBB1098300.1 zinc ABC transporter substrate-binding protein [Limosilactobacillus rudii]MCD7135308.1 zinc ABC transporter substrate-binding protein [Limosilactobacillus rudii]
MKKYVISVSSIIVLLLIILGLSFVPWKSLGKDEKPIRVVTGLNFYGEVAQKVAGNHGEVISFIDNASVDPHDYQPSTKQAQQVANANIVIENGLGYDSWMNKLVKSSDNRNKIKVIDVASLIGKKDGDNEHIWYNPSTVKKLANDLANQYSKLDPQHAGEYKANARKYLKSLKPLDNEIAKVKKNVNPNNNQVAVSEPVFDYALEAAGYQVMDEHFEKAVEDGNDPSPKDIEEIQQAITNHQIAFFVDNSQTSDKVIDNLVKLARENNVPVLKVTETKPNGDNYTEWMLKQYRALSEIQQKEN